jgi:TPR repeat protein
MANVTLSKLYLAGEGVQQSDEMAFKYMKKAAEGGDFYGEGYLAEFYRTGTGNPGDMREAVRWRDKLTATNAGEDVWEDIRDIKRKSLELFGIVGDAVSASQRKIDACVHGRQMGGHPGESYSDARSYCEAR